MRATRVMEEVVEGAEDGRPSLEGEGVGGEIKQE